MRARYPDVEGFIECDGVKAGYEVFGEGEPAVVFTPVDAIVQSRAWKAQVPYLARMFKVVTIDPRGNGRSDRPQAAAAYADAEFVTDTIAVMDSAGVDQAVLVGLCSSSWRALATAVRYPSRVLGVVAVRTAASRSRAVSGSPSSPAVSCWCWRGPGTSPRPGSPWSSTGRSGTSPTASAP